MTLTATDRQTIQHSIQVSFQNLSTLLSIRLDDIELKLLTRVGGVERGVGRIEEALDTMALDIGILKFDGNVVKGEARMLQDEVAHVKLLLNTIKQDVDGIKAQVGILKLESEEVKADVDMIKAEILGMREILMLMAARG